MGNNNSSTYQPPSPPPLNSPPYTCDSTPYIRDDRLLFHPIHGKNITLSHDRKIARRTSSFCYGVAFSSRPIRINERISIRLETISTMWSGVMRFGVTCVDPNSLNPNDLPRYLCPDLTNKPGFWAKALSDDFAIENNVISFFVNHTGELHFSVNGNEQETFISGINLRSHQPIWMVVDVYGNSTALRIMGNGVNIEHPMDYCGSSPTRRRHNNPRQSRQNIVSSTLDDLRQILPPSLLPNNLSRSSFSTQHGNDIAFPDPYNAIKGWRYVGGNIVFSGKPYSSGESWFLKVNSQRPTKIPVLGVGITSCNPDFIDMESLNGNADDLMDRLEYWVMHEVFPAPNVGDFFSITLSSDGCVMFQVIGGEEQMLFHCDTSLPLWFIIDMRGDISHLISVAATTREPRNLSPLPPAPGMSAHLETGTSVDDIRYDLNVDLNIDRLAEGAAQMFSNITRANLVASEDEEDSVDEDFVDVPAGNDVEILPGASVSTQGASGIAPPDVREAGSNDGEKKDSECSLCVDAPANYAIYDCGHVCLCEACSKKLLQMERFPKCPICRKPIKDVMKLYHI
uniref:neuralized-a protein isoform X2 n=1 Tax=Ciona intestinalis TaxID=7719 RepID=UPI00052125FC|nr:neuralized-a protein isoform X2 [Ciona intestinalis]|eukprot:XP_009859191.1 neuralized-a protein isoform X2 [Ciona intestinalis]